MIYYCQHKRYIFISLIICRLFINRSPTLPVAHTHEDIDQTFSTYCNKIRRNNVVAEQGKI